MSNNDPQREFAVDVVERLKQAGHTALWAGGCVRDFLMGREPQDYDVATDAVPDQVREIFGRSRTLTVGASFGVIVVVGSKQSGNVEVATFRTEGPYSDGRRPDRVAFSSPQEDAAHRDFTINGMFYDPIEQQVMDYVGGEKDLSAGIVRAIGDPHERLAEDKLRMLRAVRFTASMEFELDATTAAAVSQMAGNIQTVSSERIAQELRRMLVDQHRKRAMELAHELNLLDVVLPELDASQWATTLRMLQHLQNPSFELATATLLHTISEADVGGICKRLRLSNHETDHICWLIAHKVALADAPELPLATLKRLLGHQHHADLLSLSRVRALATNADLSSVVFCEEFLHSTPANVIDPPALLTGEHLIARGMRPGPRFKQLLESVRDAQLNNEIDSLSDALKLVDRLNESGSDDKNVS